jgi:hypothetical protein
MSTELEIRRHKKQLEDLSKIVVATTTALAVRVRSNSVYEVAGALRTTLPPFVKEFGSLAGVVGTSYYANARRGAGAVDSFVPIIAEFSAKEITNSTVAYAADSMVKNPNNYRQVVSNLAGDLQRQVLNIERETVLYNVTNDKFATGWQRVANSDACGFCAMASFEPTISFSEPESYHTNCSCSLEPIFRGQTAYEPDYYQDFQQQYFQATAELGQSSDPAAIVRQIERTRKAEDRLADARLLTSN